MVILGVGSISHISHTVKNYAVWLEEEVTEKTKGGSRNQQEFGSIFLISKKPPFLRKKYNGIIRRKKLKCSSSESVLEGHVRRPSYVAKTCFPRNRGNRKKIKKRKCSNCRA